MLVLAALLRLAGPATLGCTSDPSILLSGLEILLVNLSGTWAGIWSPACRGNAYVYCSTLAEYCPGESWPDF